MKSKYIDFTIHNLCQDTARFIDDIQKEPDRSVPIVAMAFLDDVIRKMLEAYFINDHKIVKQVLEYPGALSNSAARADLAFCLGLIPAKSYEDFCRLRKIRNKFSHSHHPIDFKEQNIAAICKTLNFYKIISSSQDHKYSPREQFLITAIMLVNTTLLKALSLKNSKIPKDYEIVEIIKS